jgi:hypothetical protein
MFEKKEKNISFNFKEANIIWLIDFDQTITKEHTYCNLELSGSKLNNGKKLLKNIYEPEMLKQFIKDAKNKGEQVGVATFSYNQESVEYYLEALLGSKWKKYIFTVVTNDKQQSFFKKAWRAKEYQKFYYKMRQIQFILRGLNKDLDSMKKQELIKIVLIDDSLASIKEAKTYGLSTIHVKYYKDKQQPENYFGKIKKLREKIINILKEKNESVYSDSELKEKNESVYSEFKKTNMILNKGWTRKHMESPFEYSRLTYNNKLLGIKYNIDLVNIEYGEDANNIRLDILIDKNDKLLKNKIKNKLLHQKFKCINSEDNTIELIIKDFNKLNRVLTILGVYKKQIKNSKLNFFKVSDLDQKEPYQKEPYQELINKNKKGSEFNCSIL